MRNIKTYENYIDKKNADENSELLKKYKYKIGDIIKLHNIVFEIIGINTNDPFQPYQLKNIYDEYWFDSKYFETPTDKELDDFIMKRDANKFNL
jgi:hypothetical protein